MSSVQDHSSENMGSCACQESSPAQPLPQLQEQQDMFRSVFPGGSSDASLEYEDDDEGIIYDRFLSLSLSPPISSFVSTTLST